MHCQYMNASEWRHLSSTDARAEFPETKVIFEEHKKCKVAALSCVCDWPSGAEGPGH